MFLNEGSGENGEHPISFELIFCKSRRSLLILADVNSLCCSEVEYDSLVNSCISALYCADIGIGSGVLGFRPYWCPSPFPSLSILGVFHSLLSAIEFQLRFFFTADVSPPIRSTLHLLTF